MAWRKVAGAGWEQGRVDHNTDRISWLKGHASSLLLFSLGK